MAKTSKKTAAKKTAAKKTAAKKTEKVAAVVIPKPKKGDIVRAYGKHFMVEATLRKATTIRGRHVPYIENRVSGNLSRDIPFEDVTAVFRLLEK